MFSQDFGMTDNWMSEDNGTSFIFAIRYKDHSNIFEHIKNMDNNMQSLQVCLAWSCILSSAGTIPAELCRAMWSCHVQQVQARHLGAIWSNDSPIIQNSIIIKYHHSCGTTETITCRWWALIAAWTCRMHSFCILLNFIKRCTKFSQALLSSMQSSDDIILQLPFLAELQLGPDGSQNSGGSGSRPQQTLQFQQSPTSGSARPTANTWNS